VSLPNTSSGSRSPCFTSKSSPAILTKPATKSGSKFRAKLVAMAPGITFTTRMLSSSSSARSVAEMQFTACLVEP
jgi:hypothetical protein